jgi:hypothetical protein
LFAADGFSMPRFIGFVNYIQAAGQPDFWAALSNNVWADVTRSDYASFLDSAAVDPYGLPYYHPGYEYQTPVQWMSINNRRFMVACLHDPGWINLCQLEFEKSLSLGASGILYDEAFHHYAATHCFSEKHGHRIPATLASGDLSRADLSEIAAAAQSIRLPAVRRSTIPLDQAGSFSFASPESPELQPCGLQVIVPARSALMLFETE